MVTDVTATLEVLLPASFVFAGILLFLQFRHSLYKRSVNSLLQGCLDGVLVVDMQRSVLFHNEAFSALWKFPPELLRSRDDRRLLAYATAQLVDPDSYVAGVENAFASQEARWHDLAELKDGRIFERRSKPFWQDGVIKGRLFSFRDITERCRTEETLRAEARRHEAFSRMALLSLVEGGREEFWKSVQELVCQGLRAEATTIVFPQSRFGLNEAAKAELSEAGTGDAIWRSGSVMGKQLIVTRRGRGDFSQAEVSFLTDTACLLEGFAKRTSAASISAEALPFLSPEKAKPVVCTQGSGKPSLQEDHNKLQLLVVEDNPINQKVLVQMLKRVHHRVDVANDGAEAVEMAAQTTYDLILMDCQMPRMDGFDATRAIRAEGLNRSTNIVAVTANAFPEDRTRCLDAGMNDHVPKPLTKARLEETLSRWLHGQPQ